MHCTLFKILCFSGIVLSVPPPAITETVCAHWQSVIGGTEQTTQLSEFCTSFAPPATETSYTTSTITPPDATTTRTTTITAAPLTSTDTLATSQTTTSTVKEIFRRTLTTTAYTTETRVLSCVKTGTTLSPYGPSTTTSSQTQNRRALLTVGLPTFFEGLASSAITTACSCLISLPTPTSIITSSTTLPVRTQTAVEFVTTTPVTTITTIKTLEFTNTITSTTTLDPITSTVTITSVSPSASLSGLKYYRYNSNYNYSNKGQGVNPTSFQNPGFTVNGTLTDMNVIYNSEHQPACTLPGQPSASNCEWQAVVMQGFFYAQTAGEYNFYQHRDTIDNHLMMYMGQVAYGQSTWTTADLSFNARRTGSGHYGASYTVTLAAGELVPVSWIFVNGGDGSRMALRITRPDGAISTSTDGYFMQPCEGSPFAP